LKGDEKRKSHGFPRGSEAGQEVDENMPKGPGGGGGGGEETSGRQAWGAQDRGMTEKKKRVALGLNN